MDNWGTMSFGSVYGPAAGAAVAERASASPNGLARTSFGALNIPLGIPALIALGFMAWYVIRTTD